MPKKFAKLRHLIRERYLTIDDIAKCINHSHAYANDRMTGKKQWEQCDMYAIIHFLDIPENQMHIYFPENGDDQEINSRYLEISSHEAKIVKAYGASPFRDAIDELLGMHSSNSNVTEIRR